MTHLYSAPEIDAATKQWNDSMSISSILDELQLPLYAIEQFFEAGLLARCDDPILAIMLRRPMALASTYDTFLKRLMRSRSRRTRPTDTLPISQESRRIGGHAKPWSDIYEALISKHIPFWPDGGVSTEHLCVRRGGLDAFIDVAPRRTGTSAPDMSTHDVAELLNIIPGDVRKLRIANILPHAMGTRALTTPRADVERLAAQWVSAAEMARRARIPAFHVNDQLRASGFQRHHGLWCRAEVLAALPRR